MSARADAIVKRKAATHYTEQALIGRLMGTARTAAQHFSHPQQSLTPYERDIIETLKRAVSEIDAFYSDNVGG